MSNDGTMQKIEMLMEAKARNLIFTGEEKDFMRQSALDIASAWLCTSVEDVIYHPDFKEIFAENGSICSEQAEIIQKMATYIPQSEKAVCIVNNAETMTVDLQNKLLKVLEDGEKILAVIFISKTSLIDTVTSRCLTIDFPKTPISVMAATAEYRKISILLACDGSKELYKKIEVDNWFSQYLEGFYSSLIKIKERKDLKNILRLTHALKEKDAEYLPEKMEDWQMRAFLCMIKKLFWHVMIAKYGMEVPCYLKIGNLDKLYRTKETENIYRKAEDAERSCQKKGSFSKNDFFEFLMYMIPLDEKSEAEMERGKEMAV